MTRSCRERAPAYRTWLGIKASSIKPGLSCAGDFGHSVQTTSENDKTRLKRNKFSTHHGLPDAPKTPRISGKTLVIQMNER